MQLRPFAPLAVIGAGLLIMSLATHPASADDAGAPVDVSVVPSGSNLVVTWSAPGGDPSDYDLAVTDAGSGERLLERTLAPSSTQAQLVPADLAGATDVVIVVASEYGQGRRFPGTAVRVTLPGALLKPELPPVVRAEGRALKVVLPAAGEGVTGRVVQLYRDGAEWKVVSLPASRTTLTRRAAPGHEYAAAYQQVSATAASPFSEQSDGIAVSSAAGPTAVRTIRLTSVGGGLRVRWSAAEVRGAELEGYRVRIAKDGARVGSAYAAAGVRSVVVPGAGGSGRYAVTVTAKDAAGGSSSSTAALTPAG